MTTPRPTPEELIEAIENELSETKWERAVSIVESDRDAERDKWAGAIEAMQAERDAALQRAEDEKRRADACWRDADREYNRAEKAEADNAQLRAQLGRAVVVVKAADRLTDCIAEFPHEPQYWGEHIDQLCGVLEDFRTVEQDKPGPLDIGARARELGLTDEQDKSTEVKP